MDPNPPAGDFAPGQPPTVHDRLAEIASTFGLTIIYSFGSRARQALEWSLGTGAALERGGSDLDIGVLARPALSLDRRVRIAQALEDLFGVSRVDLIDLAAADPFLAVNVIRGERLYEADSRAADEYDLYVLRRAGDLAPFEEERIRLALGGRDDA
jgi:predicted nucleotidyltransferase